MSQIKKIVTLVGMSWILLWSSACGSSTPTSPPALDLNAFRTEVAATVLAQVSQDAALTPSDSPAPSPTETFPPPTETIVPPNLTATLAAVFIATNFPATGTPGVPTPGVGTPGVAPTVGATATAAINLAQWVSQSIADGATFLPGETFTMTWRIQNVGPSAWTAAYLVRFYSGDAFGAPKEIRLGRVVNPNDTVDISIKMKAPAIPGNYRTDWVLSNEIRSNFKEPVFLKITVSAPPTPTRRPTSTPAS